MSRQGPHPALFAALIPPYGAAFGFVAYALPVLATRKGVSAEAVGSVIAFSFLMHTLKPLWAPLVDTTLTRKTWYVISVILCALGVLVSAAMPLHPDSMGLLTVVVVGSQLGATLMGMACEGLIALTVPEAEKGRASGWYNTGIYFGVGLGAWGSLKLVAGLPESWMAGAVVGGVMLLCVVPLLFLPSPPPSSDHPHELGQAMRQFGRDLRELVTSRFALTGLFIALSPVGATAAANLFNAIAPEWGVNETFSWDFFGVPLNADDVLGLINGLIGSGVSMVGALAGGYLADRVPRRLLYALSGAIMAVCNVIMAFSPSAPFFFIGALMVYAFFAGISTSAFSAFVFETIGKGAVATKYNIFAGCANLAIMYMGFIDSYAVGRWQARGMLLTDAACAGTGLVFVLFVLSLTQARRPAKT